MFDAKLYKKLMTHVREDESGCWLWTGAWYFNRPYPGNRYGYTALKIDGKWRARTAHRAVWISLHGWPEGAQVICHRCDVPLCVNPEHLYLGTMADNMRDRDERGRNHNLNRTQCKFGHPYDEANTVFKPNGARACRACISIRHKKRWATDPAFRAKALYNQRQLKLKKLQATQDAKHE